VDGTQRHIGKAPPATYFTIDATRGWKGLGSIKLVIPKTLRVEACADHPAAGQVFFGGLALYGVTSNTAFQDLDCATFEKGSGLTWSASGFTFKPFFNVASDHYSMYWNISNVPANWQDTVLDAVDDSPMSIADNSCGERLFSAIIPLASLTKSRIRISFLSAFQNETPLNIRLFNAKGVIVWDCKGMAHRGDRSVKVRGPRTALPAGIYRCVISAGALRFTVSTMLEK